GRWLRPDGGRSRSAASGRDRRSGRLRCPRSGHDEAAGFQSAPSNVIYTRAGDHAMPNYSRLHELVSHRVTFEYDTGAKIVGYIAACKPATGPVQVVVMSRVDILDDKGRVLEHHDEFSFVPNVLTNFRLTEGPI